MCILLTIASFMVNKWYAFKSVSFDYYFPFCRFWQISIGAILVCYNFDISNKIFKNFISIVGITFILLSSWVISEKDIYPGYLALIPTSGAAMLILASQETIFNKYILSSRIMTYIGKISFPLYLWHWPLLAFARYIY